jgi:hypothetical protein
MTLSNASRCLFLREIDRVMFCSFSLFVFLDAREVGSYVERGGGSDFFLARQLYPLFIFCEGD